MNFNFFFFLIVFRTFFRLVIWCLFREFCLVIVLENLLIFIFVYIVLEVFCVGKGSRFMLNFFIDCVGIFIVFWFLLNRDIGFSFWIIDVFFGRIRVRGGVICIIFLVIFVGSILIMFGMFWLDDEIIWLFDLSLLVDFFFKFFMTIILMFKIFFINCYEGIDKLLSFLWRFYLKCFLFVMRVSIRCYWLDYWNIMLFFFFIGLYF